MRHMDLTTPAPPSGDRARTARLTRHLRARLLDFGPGGPEVCSADEERGVLRARFPSHDTGQVLRGLEDAGIQAAQDGDDVVFLLSPDVQFEDLDYLWGCLFTILG